MGKKKPPLRLVASAVPGNAEELLDRLAAAVGRLKPDRRKALDELLMTDIETQLRRAIVDSGLTCYRIGKDAGVDVASVDRFVKQTNSLRLDVAAKVAAYLGLELRPIEKPPVKAKKRKAPSR